MGLNFRKLLISELERRQQEIDSLLHLLRFLQSHEFDSDGFQWNDKIVGLSSSIQASPFRDSGSRHETILDLRQKGLSLRAIAEQVCLSHAGVWKALQRWERNQMKDLGPVGPLVVQDKHQCL